MAIRFICPQGHQLTVPDERVGMRGTCPRCNCSVLVPMQDDVPTDDVSSKGSGWEEVLFEDTAQANETSGVAVPIEDDNVAMAELAEPLSPSDFAAKQDTTSHSSGDEAPPEALLEPMSPADFAKGKPPADLPSVEEPPPVQSPAVQPPPSKVDLPIGGSETRDGSGFRLDDASLRTVYIWALVEAAVTLLVAIPALEHLGLSGAPPWAWVVLLLVALHSAYVMWVVALPDWSTVWLGSLMFGLTSATHLIGLVLTLVLPQGNLLGLPSGSWATPLWCTVVAITTAAMAYGCIHISHPWRVAYESYKAGIDEGEEVHPKPPALERT